MEKEKRHVTPGPTVLNSWSEEREIFDAERREGTRSNEEFLNHLLEVHRVLCRSCRPETTNSKWHNQERNTKVREGERKETGTQTQQLAGLLHQRPLTHMLQQAPSSSHIQPLHDRKNTVQRTRTLGILKKEMERKRPYVSRDRGPNIKIIKIVKSKSGAPTQVPRVAVAKNLVLTVKAPTSSVASDKVGGPQGASLVTSPQQPASLAVPAGKFSPGIVGSSSTFRHPPDVALGAITPGASKLFQAAAASSMIFPGLSVSSTKSTTAIPYPSTAPSSRHTSLPGGIAAFPKSLSQDLPQTSCLPPSSRLLNGGETVLSSRGLPGHGEDIPSTSSRSPREDEDVVVKEESMEDFQGDELGMADVGLCQPQCIDEDDDDEDDFYDDGTVQFDDDDEDVRLRSSSKTAKLPVNSGGKGHAMTRDEFVKAAPLEETTLTHAGDDGPEDSERDGEEEHHDQNKLVKSKPPGGWASSAIQHLASQLNLMVRQPEPPMGSSEGETSSDMVTSSSNQLPSTIMHSEVDKTQDHLQPNDGTKTPGTATDRAFGINSPQMRTDKDGQESPVDGASGEKRRPGAEDSPGTSKGVTNKCQCLFCDFTTVNTAAMNDHVQTHIPDTPGPLNLSIDMNWLKSKSQKSYHQNPGWCDKCEKLFLNFSAHMRSKHFDADILCPTCGKVVKERCYKVHQRLHSHVDEKDHVKCEFCGAMFKYRSYLENHVRRAHTNSDRKYECDTCGKRFPTPQALQRHDFVHTGVKPFQCTECDKSFTQKSNLSIHMRQHTGLKPYKCEFCGAAFANNVSRKNHKKKMHGVDWWKMKEEES